MLACSHDDSKATPEAEIEATREAIRHSRIARFEAQAAATRALLDIWQPWYDELQSINHGRIDLDLPPYGDIPAGTMILTNLSQRILYSNKLSRTPLADDGSLPDGFRRPLETLVQIARQLREAGIDFLLMPVPPKAAIYPEMVQSTPPGPPPLLDWRLRQWYAELERGGVEVLDLLPELARRRYRQRPSSDSWASDAPETVYLRTDSHWSPYGSMIAAELLSERIRRYPWFADAVRDNGEAVVDEYLETLRDASSDVPAYRTRIRGEQERTISDRESPVLVLGDSYCYPRYGLSDQMLKQLGFRVDLLFAAGGTGLFDSLKRLERLPEKRLVVFEFYPAHSLHTWTPFDLPQLQADGSSAF